MEQNMWIKKVLNIGSRLNYISRWAGTPRFVRQSVAEHSFNVTLKADILGHIEKNIYGKDVDFAKLLRKAYSHDLPEGLTGDIISPTKQYMKKEVAFIEDIMYTKEVDTLLPDAFKEDIKALFIGHKDTTLEGYIVHAADLLDALDELVREYIYKTTPLNESQLDISDELLKDKNISELVNKILDIPINSTKYYLEAYMNTKFNKDNQENNTPNEEGLLKLGVTHIIKCRNCGGEFEGADNNNYKCPYCLKSFDIEPVEG